ncbi:hypothetical protein CVIRNUC_004201 [Coccomyxa viridis]|uniref:Uncharacterized protein n=1 Tax=Coccomyxa viridis TaxID=1274662 RepID=A0AAV1I2F2_9CHLO|nr:hypothetical protein CVIRNUC_004201 [Coccomyxa viridis]
MPTLRFYALDAAALDYIVDDNEPYAILLCRAGNISLRIPVMSCWMSPHSEITYRTPHRRAVVVLTEHSVACLMAVRCCASEDAVPQPTTVTDKAALMADNASASPERSGARSKETRATPAPPVEHLGQKASASGNGWLLQTSCLVAD